MESRKIKKVEKTGIVVSDKMDKSRIVLVESKSKHPFYHKFIKKRKKIMVHDEANVSKKGDTVSIIQCRPLSRRKRWMIKEVMSTTKNLNPG